MSKFTLGWDDPDEAEVVAVVLLDAALDYTGRTIDVGLQNDANSLLEQVIKWRDDHPDQDETLP